MYSQMMSRASFVELKRNYDDFGEAQITNIRLPEGSNPDFADIFFIQMESGNCEVFIITEVSYCGESLVWKEVFESEPVMDTARLILSTGGGIESALNKLMTMIDLHSKTHELTDYQAVAAAVSAKKKENDFSASKLFKRMTRTVKGQDQPIEILCLRTTSHVLRPKPRRPLSIFLNGQTGTGKTKSCMELTPALNELVSENNQWDFLRIDMNEYQHESRANQLLGSPQGYVGYDDGAELIETLARNPRSVILFDEIEKAHRKIFRTLMNTMDAGRLSSPKPINGVREIDCNEAIFLFTSNLAADEIVRETQELKDQAAIDKICRDKLKQNKVAVELIGRITCFLVFRPLSREIQAEIVGQSIVTIAKEYNLCVKRIDPEVIVAVLMSVQATGYGARPFEYAIDALLSHAFYEARSLGLTEPVTVKVSKVRNQTEDLQFMCIPIENTVYNSLNLIGENQ